MKTEGLVLLGVVGFCILVGVGVSKTVPSVSQAISSKEEEAHEKEELAASKLTLGKELRAGYRENIEINDEMLDNLVCSQEDSSEAKKCYAGPNPTEEKIYYGKAEVVLQGETIPVQLTSSYGSTYLEILGNPRQ